jgi:hypothetical protein
MKRFPAFTPTREEIFLSLEENRQDTLALLRAKEWIEAPDQQTSDLFSYEYYLNLSSKDSTSFDDEAENLIPLDNSGIFYDAQKDYREDFEKPEDDKMSQNNWTQEDLNCLSPDIMSLCQSELSREELLIRMGSVSLKDSLFGSVLFIKGRFSCKDATANASFTCDFDRPTLMELKLLLQKFSLSGSQWARLERYTDPDNNQLIRKEILYVWDLIVDIVRSMIVLGYLEDYFVLLQRMFSVWYHYISKLISLDYDFIKLAKYKLAAFASYGKRNRDFPVSPFPKGINDNPNIIFDRKFDVWFRSIPSSFEFDYYKMVLIDSICRGVKKGAARPSPEACEASSRKTFEKFVTKKDLITVVVNDIEIGPKEMESALRFSVREILAERSEFKPEFTAVPSMKADFRNKFSNGGQFPCVKKHIPKYPRPIEVEVKNGLLREPFIPMYDDLPFDQPTRYPISISPEEGEKWSPHAEVRTTKYLEVTTNYDQEDSDLNLEALIDKCLDEDTNISFITLSEALKMRGITKGQGLEQWLLRPLQKYLSKELFKHRCFRTTGKPICSNDLEEAIPFLESGYKILSGDYSDCTNESIKLYAEIVLDEVCAILELDVKYTKLVIRSLVGNMCWLSYLNPDYKEEEEYLFRKETNKVPKIIKIVKEQQEAQPMGKILSFVVLCIINFTVCRLSMTLDRGGDLTELIPINLCSLMVNGDDCVFPLRDFEIWEKVSSVVGWKNSVGKTFFSDEFAEMNSRTFLRKESFGNSFYEVPFINFGLLKGLQRSTGCDSSVYEELTCLGARHTKLVENLDPFYKGLDFLFKKFNARHLKSDVLMGIPYYIPEWLGGLGMDPGPDYQLMISDRQRQQALYIFQNMASSKPIKVSGLHESLLNELVEKFYRQFLPMKELTYKYHVLETEESVPTFLEQENRDVYNHLLEHFWRSKAIYELLQGKEFNEEDQFDPILVESFRKKFGTGQPVEAICDVNFSTLCAKKVRKQFKTNSLIWLTAFEKAAYTEKMFWHKLWHQPQLENFAVVTKSKERDFFPVLAAAF